MSESTTKPWMLWTGRVMSALPALLLTFSAVMKLTSAPPVLEGFKHFGFPDGLHLPIGVVEALVVVAYLVPRMAVLGAILITGYLGGAIVTHLRVGEPFAPPLLLGVLVWGGLFLRDARVRALIPLRGPAGPPVSPPGA